MPGIQIKRIYDESSSSDGIRILVDRVWPRGLSKERAGLTEWQRDLAPSTALRKWFGHDPRKWEDFRRRYRAELRRPAQARMLHQLAERGRRNTITLLYGAADQEHNQAVVLKELLENRGDARHQTLHRVPARKARSGTKLANDVGRSNGSTRRGRRRHSS